MSNALVYGDLLGCCRCGMSDVVNFIGTVGIVGIVGIVGMEFVMG
ncbi:hypothetical protein [Aliikangiella sp. IMCC44632]